MQRPYLPVAQALVAVGGPYAGRAIASFNKPAHPFIPVAQALVSVDGPYAGLGLMSPPREDTEVAPARGHAKPRQSLSFPHVAQALLAVGGPYAGLGLMSPPREETGRAAVPAYAERRRSPGAHRGNRAIGWLVAALALAAPALAVEEVPGVPPETTPAVSAGETVDAQPDPQPPPQPEPAQPQPPAQPPAQPQPGQPLRLGELTIHGDEFRFDPATSTLIVTGNPRVERGGDELRADRLLVNQLTRQVVAEGNVVLRQNNQVFRSSRATYSFDERAGRGEDVRTIFQNYFLDAEQILFRPGPGYTALRGSFTTCELPRPHYELYARELDIIPGDRLIARHVGVDFLGHRLFTLPRYRRSLKEGQEEDEGGPIYPSFGYNSYHGPYVRQDFTLRRKAPVWLDADAQLNTFREPSGGLLAATRGRLQAVGALYYRDEAENQRGRHLTVSRLPEVGLVWRPTPRARPGGFLPHQVQGVRYPEPLDISTRWRFAAGISAGYFRQHRGDSAPEDDAEGRSGGRVSLQGQGVLPLVRLGPVNLNDLRFMLRQSFYDTGDAFTVFGAGIGKKWRLSPFWRLQIHRLDQFTSGSTPFFFDDIELRQEWRPRVEYKSRNFQFTYYARIRARNFDLYDQVFEVSKLFHCIEPRLTYKVRNQEIFFEIRIPGLSGFSRRRPGQPRSVDPDEAVEPPPADPPAIRGARR